MVLLSDAQADGLLLLSRSRTWTQVSPNPEQRHGWLLHWRVYHKLAALGLVIVKTKAHQKFGEIVLVRLTPEGRRAARDLEKV